MERKRRKLLVELDPSPRYIEEILRSNWVRSDELIGGE